MFIRHSYDTRFIKMMDHFRSKYGEKMMELSGVGSKDLDINAFSKKFFKNKGSTADATIDANANVNDKSVLSWENELAKPIRKLNCLYMLWKSAMEKHGIKRANKMIESEIRGSIKIHDAHMWNRPYSYHSNTNIIIRCDGVILNKAMLDIFNEYAHMSLDAGTHDHIDFLKNDKRIEILDYDGQFVPLLHAIRHVPHNNLIQIKTIGGSELIVTEDHPIIMNVQGDYTRTAKFVQIKDNIATCDGKGDCISEIKLYQDEYKYVYDVTTATGTFKVGNIKAHNCYAGSMGPLVEKGMPFYDKIKINPPKHFDSYVNLSLQQICYFSNAISGACALPDWFCYLDYFVRKDYGEDWENKADVVEHVKQQFQSWIYSLNFSWRSNQTPFTGISIMDKYWLKNLFENYVFPDYSTPNFDNITSLQKLFVGEMIKNLKNNPFTFPVVTACLLADEVTKKPKDEEFFNWVSEVVAETGLFNIFIDSKTSSLSSCCFSGDEIITVFNTKYNFTEKISIKEFVEKFIDAEHVMIDKQLDTGYTINGYDFENDKWQETVINGVLKKPTSEKLVKIIVGKDSICVTQDHKFKVLSNNDFIQVTAKDILDKKEQYQIQAGQYDSFEKIESATLVDNPNNVVYCIQLKEHHYFKANNIKTSNCRLRNDVSVASGEFFSSLGSGGVDVGSHRVVTINLPQIAYEANNDKALFMKMLEWRIELAHEILDIHRETIQKLIENGNLPLYTFGFMNLAKQFSTLGFIGLNEAIELMSSDILTDVGTKFAMEIIGKMNEMNLKRSKTDNKIRNVEQIPGEGAAYNLAQKDSELFDAAKNKYTLYSNQFVPLTKEATLIDRIGIHGVADQKCQGGAILHINLENKVDSDVIKSLIEYASLKGVIYFAINLRILQCSSCKKTYVSNDFTKSPCHNAQVIHWQRVVGFLTNVSAWAKPRRDEYEHRQFYSDLL